MTTTILIIVNVFAALAIIVLSLMQVSKGDMGSAFGGGGSQSMFGSRGSANFLSRLTAAMCAVFFISSLALAYVYAQRAEVNSVVGSGSVIEQTSDATSADSEIPTIDGTPSTDNGVPVIGGDEELPTIEDSVPEALEAVDEAQEAAADAVDEAVEATEQDTPAVPQQ